MIKTLTISGPELSAHLHEVAALRLSVFRDFPYLYDGDLDYELDYLKHYAQCERAVFVLALYDGVVVGASTGLPMSEADEDFQRPFLQHDQPLKDIFYFGESVLHAQHRGKGLGHHFFDERERFARSQGATLTTFCAVERPPAHPLRPLNYQPLDGFWRKRGYTQRPDLTTSFVWRDLGEDQETPKPMVFWTRQLS